MKLLKKTVLITLCAAFTFWLGSLAVCEYRTYRYGEQFERAIVHDIWGERALEGETLKVLRYSETEAEIYAADPYSGRLYWFERKPGEAWRHTGWDAVWSTSGSADDYVFPYIRLKGLVAGQHKG